LKTPHTIKLVTKSGETKFDPITGGHVPAESVSIDVPCLINFITQAKVFEEYGNRIDKVMIARFNQEQAPFDYAEYKGETYHPIEQIDAPIKGAIRLKRG